MIIIRRIQIEMNKFGRKLFEHRCVYTLMFGNSVRFDENQNREWNLFPEKTNEL